MSRSPSCPSPASTCSDASGRLALLDGAWADPDTHLVTLLAWGGVGKSNLVNHWLGRMARSHYRGARRVLGWSFYSQGTRDVAATGSEFITWALKHFGEPSPQEGSGGSAASGWPGTSSGSARCSSSTGWSRCRRPRTPRAAGSGIRCWPRWCGSWPSSTLGCVSSPRASPWRTSSTSATPPRRSSSWRGCRTRRARSCSGRSASRVRTRSLRRASREFAGHALGLSLLGRYLRDTCDGDVRRRGELHSLRETSEEEGPAEKVLRSYERWFGESPERSVLRLLGLFDQPAAKEWLDVLRAPPVIPGLTGPLVGTGEPRWKRALSRLRRAGLLAKADPRQPDALDAHPLIREHFARQLRTHDPQAWRMGHERLYEYLTRSAKPLPETSEERAPLYLAMAHGCHAGRHEEVFQEVFLKRILRGADTEPYQVSERDRAVENLRALSSFFDPPWKLVPAISGPLRWSPLLYTALDLIFLGRIPESIEPLQDALQHCLAQGDREHAAQALMLLCLGHAQLGNLLLAYRYGKQALEATRCIGEPESRLGRGRGDLRLGTSPGRQDRRGGASSSRPFASMPTGTFWADPSITTRPTWSCCWTRAGTQRRCAT